MKSGFETMDDTPYSIRAEGFGAIDVLLEELKVEPARAFALAGISPSVLQDSRKNDLVDYRKFLGLLNHCAELSGRPDFGNLLSRHQQFFPLVQSILRCFTPGLEEAQCKLIGPLCGINERLPGK